MPPGASKNGSPKQMSVSERSHKSERVDSPEDSRHRRRVHRRDHVPPALRRPSSQDAEYSDEVHPTAYSDSTNASEDSRLVTPPSNNRNSSSSVVGPAQPAKRVSENASRAAEVKKGGASKREVKRCVVIDTSSLLGMNIHILNTLKERFVLCIAATVRAEMRGLGRHPKLGKKATRLWDWIEYVSDREGSKVRCQTPKEIPAAASRYGTSADASIVDFAVYLEEAENAEVILVSNDVVMQIVANAELEHGQVENLREFLSIYEQK